MRALQRQLWGAVLAASLCVSACAPTPENTQDAGPDDAGTQPTDDLCLGPQDAGTEEPDPYADRVVAFTAGESAGFGQQDCPGIVLGPPYGAGDGAGSLDVLSLGREGVIVLELTDIGVVDGEGVDLLVFENPFSGFTERGEVSVSEDGTTWRKFPCAATDAEAGYPGCAGVQPVFANPEAGISATEPAVAGGDGFDLGALGVARARFVRIRDTGTNTYGFGAGGFDLDAVAVVNGAPLPWSSP